MIRIIEDKGKTPKKALKKYIEKIIKIMNK